MRHARSRLATLATTLLIGLAKAAPVAAYPGAPWFEPSTLYTQNFPDPSVLRVGDTYYAYSTSTGGANLPVETSTDLQHWTARRAYDPGAPLNSDRYFNDALPRPAAWGASVAPGAMSKRVWSPGVARIGGRYVLYYAVQARVSPARFCISVASSASPLGPFLDGSRAPLVCSSDPLGSIDPAPFVDPATGTAWLTWKNEGVPGHSPTGLWTRQLDRTGHFAAGSVPHKLLQTSLGWEGNVIESPSMVRFAGTYWLFYSANEWSSGRYAIGYARCAGPTGPCSKVGTGPLMRSAGSMLGPGGPSAFVDAAGGLRLAHHYWNAPYTSYPAYPACLAVASCATQGQRRLVVDQLILRGMGLALR